MVVFYDSFALFLTQSVPKIKQTVSPDGLVAQTLCVCEHFLVISRVITPISVMRKIITALMLIVPAVSFAWGQKGHDVVAEIASRHLTPRATAAIDSIFEGKSMVYWANWLDNASHTPAYDYSRPWHYKNIDAEYDFDSAPLNPKGDVVTALNEQIAMLAQPSASGPERKLALKMVVHLVGDMHQPMHTGRYSDRGGNRHEVKFFDTETNLHSVWDSRLPETGHKWSYTEWAEQLDRVPESKVSEIQKGTVSSWCRETHEIAKDVYAATPQGTVVSYDYIAGWTPTVELQFLRGGLRLAHVLNYVFDPCYRDTHTSPLDKK